MNRRLYKYHNLPLYFWLIPDQAQSYNEFYKLIFEGPLHMQQELFAKAVQVKLKVQARVEDAYERGLVVESLDRSVPLTEVY